MTIAPGRLAPTRPWAREAAEVLHELDVDPALGLAEDDVVSRRTAVGPNSFPEPPTRGLLGLFADQFRDVLIYLLVAAAAISVLIGEPLEASVIGIIIVLNSIIGVFQAYRG